MIKIIKKTLLIAVLLFAAVSFSGCINLSQKPKEAATERNDHQGVFKTVDGGKTWEHKVKIETENPNNNKTDKEKLIDNVKIISMKMDPQDNKILYLGTASNGFYKSENGADSWKMVTDENGILTGRTVVYDIAIEKGNSNIVYIATLNDTRGELLKSEDGGKSWSESYITAEKNKMVNKVEIDPIHKNIVYIGTEQGGFIKSEDRGKTWYTLGWFTSGAKDFVVDFQNNKGIIIRTANEIFKSVVSGNEKTFISMGGSEGEIFESIEGNKWMNLNRLIQSSLSIKIDHTQISSMTIDNKNPLVIYITYQNLVLKTSDGGYTWEKLNTITPSLTALGTIPQIKQIGMINDTIYYGAGNVLYKSDNKGVTWSNYDIPILGDVRYTVSDYTDLDTIYLGAFYDPPPKKKK